MCGEMEHFTALDESFSIYVKLKENVKLRDNSSVVMVGKENIWMLMNEIV